MAHPAWGASAQGLPFSKPTPGLPRCPLCACCFVLGHLSSTFAFLPELCLLHALSQHVCSVFLGQFLLQVSRHREPHFPPGIRLVPFPRVSQVSACITFTLLKDNSLFSACSEPFCVERSPYGKRPLPSLGVNLSSCEVLIRFFFNNIGNTHTHILKGWT